jgi:hypothetical protein
MSLGTKLRALDRHVLGPPKHYPAAKRRRYAIATTGIGVVGLTGGVAFVTETRSPGWGGLGGFLGLTIGGVVRWVAASRDLRKNAPH